jgi:hypothetical protein
VKTGLLASVLCAVCLSPLRGETFTYWIQPCNAGDAHCEPADAKFAQWAMRAWEQATHGAIEFTPSPLTKARVRVYWAGEGSQGLYGESRAIEVQGKAGAEVFVLCNLRSLGAKVEELGTKDPLFRDSIVYLTALHEIGHAIGLAHTRSSADVMYSFEYGGNVAEYFSRYRRKLRERADIRENSGLSADDQRHAQAIYKPEAVSDAQRSAQ